MTNQHTFKDDLKKIQQSKQLLTIFILLFVALLFWIIISLVTSQTTEKISPELQKLAKPLTPTVDTSILEKISGKIKYSDDELSTFTIFKILTSRDGKTEKVVPLEVSIEDLEPKATVEPKSAPSLLNQEATDENTQTLDQTQNVDQTPTLDQTQNTNTDNADSALGGQL